MYDLAKNSMLHMLHFVFLPVRTCGGEAVKLRPQAEGRNRDRHCIQIFNFHIVLPVCSLQHFVAAAFP